ncbi:Ni/Fe hydrogenase subunit alpha [Candidatus Kuenenbacteria bacterium]|nr:Ni/Fe hydrogenase subunit alpha [Candidatus Kuenenbacteria bacterium]
MKTIKINHIAKTEGHLSFVGAMLDNNFAQAHIETEEGARLIEGILLGRKYYEAPIITSRICGVCPIVHNLTSIKAMESALNVKVTPEIILLRKILENAQIIHSHAIHAYFFSFPDIIGVSNNFNLINKFPKESKIALEVRDWGVQLARIIGGRTVHPINSVIGGFNVEPDLKELDEFMAMKDEVLKKAAQIYNFVIKYKLPKFQRPTNYVSLKSNSEYAVYDGKIYFSDNKSYDSAETFLRDVQEIVLPHEKVKRTQHLERAFMVGALARLNNSFDQLNPEAKKAWNKLKIKLPCYNSFYNILAQVVEIVNCIEELEKDYKLYKKISDKKLLVEVKPRSGKGYAVMEAPRGLLYHEYELNAQGNILHCNVITPTAMFLANLEKDLEQLLPQIKNYSDKKQKDLIKTLIRAYDPCISCATH